MIMQQLFQNIFRREENSAHTKSFLDRTRAQYPYFGPAHFYSLKNTDPADADHPAEAAKAALFFNDLFFLDQQLKDKPAAEKNIVSHEALPVEEPEEHTHEEPVPAAEPVEIKAEEIAAMEEKTEPVPVEIKPPAHATIEDMPLFEPLHATDYFASQGIKLSEDMQPNDKLGQQLKSFTSWLKTMKKVHTGNLPASVAVEIAVQSQAEKSNIEEEVVTEAMAEAYIQQGKRAKAADIYSKLSLLNPSKTAYFAAKIESLNQ